MTASVSTILSKPHGEMVGGLLDVFIAPPISETPDLGTTRDSVRSQRSIISAQRHLPRRRSEFRIFDRLLVLLD